MRSFRLHSNYLLSQLQATLLLQLRAVGLFSKTALVCSLVSLQSNSLYVHYSQDAQHLSSGGYLRLIQIADLSC